MKKKRAFNKADGWQKIKAAIVGEIMDPQSVESRADLMLPAYAALNALETGHLDVDGYFRINEMNCVALCLAARLHAQGSAAIKAAMEVDLLIVQAAADAMNAIGERYNRTGRFGATGEQLQQVRATITTVTAWQSPPRWGSAQGNKGRRYGGRNNEETTAGDSMTEYELHTQGASQPSAVTRYSLQTDYANGVGIPAMMESAEGDYVLYSHVRALELHNEMLLEMRKAADRQLAEARDQIEAIGAGGVSMMGDAKDGHLSQYANVAMFWSKQEAEKQRATG